MEISKRILALVAVSLIVYVGYAFAASDQQLMDVPAIEILTKIRNDEPVEYDHITVIGDLMLEDVIIKSPIRINDSKFNGQVSFTFSTFRKSIDISSSNFTKEIDFSKSTFNQYASFSYSAFGGNTKFVGSVFNENAYFHDCIFNENVEFRESVFDNYAYFWRSKFNKDAFFWESVFKGAAKFQRSEFNGITYFGWIYYNGPKFYEDADFTESTFKGDTYFTASIFDGDSFFTKSIFAGNAFFSDCTFEGNADFEDGQLNGKAIFENAHFIGPLNLKRLKYDEVYIRWISIDNLSFDDTAYLRLIENFKKLGFYSDADQCYVSYRNANRQNLPIYYQPIDFFLWILYGYGTMPELPVIWSLFVILLCGGFFYFTADIETPDKKTTLVEAMYLSAAAFTSGARTLGGFVSTPEDVKVKGRARYVLAVEKLLGLLLVGLFLTALARTVIR